MDWTRSQRGAALGLLLRVLPVSCFGPHVSHIKQLGFSSSDRCSAAGMASLVRGGSRTRPAMPRTHAHSDEPPQLALHSLAMPQDGSTIRNFDETLVKKEKKAQARGQAGEACTLEDDYGTLFRGTETLFRFCTNDKVVNDKVVSAGKFKEGGKLDRLDKALSGPIFRMQVPKYVEAGIIVPGTMFGVMLQSLIMLPTVLPLLLPGPLDLRYLLAVMIPMHILGALRIREWLEDPGDMRKLMCNKVVPYIGWIHMALAALVASHSAAPAAVTFYVCAWFYSQLINQSLKNTFWRRRPTASLSEKDGELAPRHFPQFKWRLKELPECLESFPSGDSAGAGAFGLAACLISGNPLWLLATAAGMFGRVFIHAHHLLDVFAGASIGLSVTAILNWSIGGWQHCGVKHLLLCTAVSFVAHKMVLPLVKQRKMLQEEKLVGVAHVIPCKPLCKERLQGMT